MSKWIARLAVLLESERAEEARALAPTKPTEHPSRPVVSVVSVTPPGAFERIECKRAEGAPVLAPTKLTEPSSHSVVSVSSVTPPCTVGGIEAIPGPFALRGADADRAHATRWSERAVLRYVARVTLFVTPSISTADAEDLAERLHLRDVDRAIGLDHRVMCIECRHHRRAADDCANHDAAGTRLRGRHLWTMLQVCPGFADAAHPEA